MVTASPDTLADSMTSARWAFTWETVRVFMVHSWYQSLT
jgi:hypothetical protein